MLPPLLPLVLLTLPPADAPRASFQQDVVPLLTRAGCNAGACHGTPQGKNGFRLSLRGYDPALDYQSLTHDAAGRRLDRVNPDASLLLLKATGQVPHEGGKRFDSGDRLYTLLRQWIAQGAEDDSATAPQVVTLKAFAEEQVLKATAESTRVHVLVYTSMGVLRNVSHLARFSVNDESVASVSSAGVVEQRKPGEVAVSAEYRGQMSTANVVFPRRDPSFTWLNPPEHNFIDRHVFAKLRRLQIAPSPLCRDDEFLRRVTLDVLGKLPAPDEVRAFLADKSADKRDRLIDRLLERDEFADWWAMKWADRLGCNQRFVGKIGAAKYHQWIRQAMLANVPEDEFIRAVLSGRGGNYGSPPAGFYRRLRDPQTRAEEVAQLFLGVRLQCAKCHNHPGERWTQDDYHGLAAFFARLAYRDGPYFVQIYDKEETVYPVRTGEVTHPRTGQVVAPKFLGDPQPVCKPDEDRIELLARWLTARENQFFARAAINRIWYHLFGRGLVDPVDDLRSTNPASNEELLDALTRDFTRNGFDRKQLIRTILRSRTYQLSSETSASNADDDKYCSHARVRLLQAEQLMDAICAATGVAEKFPGFPPGTPAVALPDGEYKHPFLEAFGRPARAMACECERDPDTTLTQALQLVGGRFVHDKLRGEDGRVARLLAAGRTDAEMVEELFLATLSRYPTDEERQSLVARLGKAGPARRRVAEDVLWALLNHNEFLFQH